jgi:hypothetical protein
VGTLKIYIDSEKMKGTRGFDLILLGVAASINRRDFNLKAFKWLR